jgi:bacterioferritin
LGKLLIGEDVPEMMKGDLQAELENNAVLKSTIATCEQAGDLQSREHLKELLEHNEDRIDDYETELALIESMGIQNYVQHQSTGA